MRGFSLIFYLLAGLCAVFLLGIYVLKNAVLLIGIWNDAPKAVLVIAVVVIVAIAVRYVVARKDY
jgi:hypothetical protein